MPSGKGGHHFSEAHGKIANPCVMVIFGASGDLAKRLLLPSICNLGASKLIADNFTVIGVSRSDFTTESFRAYMADNVKQFVKTEASIAYGNALASRMDHVKGELDDPATYHKLESLLEQLEAAGGTKNRIYYLAVPPQFFGPVIEQLGNAHMVSENEEAFRRIIIEKPFGHDLESAIALDQHIKRILPESQVFRIDHYLGKETVQNLLAFRFANGIFEPIWNRRYVDHIQITVAESMGVGTRGGYYEQSGALKDMIPNHIFQLLSLTAMEPPISLEADAVRDEKAKVLRAIPDFTPEDVLTNAVRGQYGPGKVGETEVPGYRSEKGVAPNSSVETYVALKLMVDNWRWAGVPFYIRTGKRLPSRVTEIAIQFKKAPEIMFQQTQVSELSPNLLVIHVQPEEGISLRFGAKVPGPIVRLGDVNMTFKYEDYFGTHAGTGYETLLYDCMMGDGTLYQRADMVESGWRVVQPILDVWKALNPRQFPNYAAGTSGPKEADELLAKDGRSWRKIKGS